MDVERLEWKEAYRGDLPEARVEVRPLSELPSPSLSLLHACV